MQWNRVLGFSQECETPPVTDLLICYTRQVLLEWNFSSSSKTIKIKLTKAPYRQGPLWQASLTPGTVGQIQCCFSVPAYLAVYQVPASIYILQMAETRENILTGH